MSDHDDRGFDGREFIAMCAATGILAAPAAGSRDHNAAYAFSLMLWRRRMGALAAIPA